MYTLLEDIVSYDVDTRVHLTSSALQTLRDMNYPDFGSVAIDIAFGLSEMDAYFVQKQLAAWFETQNDEVRNQVMNKLLDVLYPHGEEARVTLAIDTITMIGFRSEPVDERLHTLMAQADSPGVRDAALWALTWLGSPDVDGIEAALQTRLDNVDDLRDTTAACLRILRSNRLLATVQTAYQKHTTNDVVLTSLMRALADTAWQYPDQAGPIWQILIGHPPDLIERHINTAGDIASLFDDQCVPDYFLAQILSSHPTEDVHNPGRIPRYAPYQRLKSMFLPRALEGLHQSAIRENTELIQTIKTDATSDTGNRQPWQTGGTILKEHSWEVALRLGLLQVYDWFPSALVEANPFTKGNVAQLAGFLRAESAVPALRDTVTNLDLHPILRNQALLALGYIGTRASLEALLHVRLPPDRVPLDWAHGLTLATLATRNVEGLLTVQENLEASISLQIASAAALDFVAASDPELVMPLRGRILQLIVSSDNPSDPRLLHLLSALNALSLDEEQAQTLLDIARNTSVPALKLQAVLVLASHDRFINQSDLYGDFGLVHGEDGWQLTRTLHDNEVILLGVLFQKDPQSFSTAMSNFIEGDSGTSLYQILPRIETLPTDGLPISLQEQLEKRIRPSLHSILVESDLINAFARLAPKRFLDLVEEEEISTLPPHIRKAMVDAMSHPIAKPELTARAAEILLLLLTDEVKDVRTRAAQILSEYYAEGMTASVSLLCQSSRPRERVCGIQAAVLCDTQTFFNFCQPMAHDSEVKVRSAAMLATRTKKEREIAASYLEKLKELRSSQLLEVWHYGDALRAVGDETTVGKLREMSEDISLGSHIRAWFLWLANKVTASVKERANQLDQELD